MKKPLLSVCLITYNHSLYIRQAIDGVLMQKTDFPFDLVIADDFSTDGTRDILRAYQEKYPSKIKLILQEKNVGPARNWIDLISAPESKYLAYFEGDDYWTDMLKLQKQIDFLEQNPDYVLCSANADVENLTGKHFRPVYCNFEKDMSFDQADILADFYCPSLSPVMRNMVSKLPEWLINVKSGDTFLYYLLSKYGKFYYMNAIVGVYRLHSSGISNSNNRMEWHENTIYYLDKLKEYIRPENLIVLKEVIYKAQLSYIADLIKEKQYKKVKSYKSQMERLPFNSRLKFLKERVNNRVKKILPR